MAKFVNELSSAFNQSTSTSTTIAPTPATPVTNEHWPLFVTLVSISVLCLLITVILYLMICEKHNCQAWTQFSYLVALLLFDIVFIPSLCPGLTNGAERNIICITLSISNQYFFVSSKTWLIIISIDMYCTIRKPQAVVQNTTKNLPQFFIYSVIGWVLPAIFSASGIILNWKNRKKLPMDDMSDPGLWTPFPDYGFLHCRIPPWFVWECFVFGNCIFHFFMFGLISYTIWYQRESFVSTDENRTTRRKRSSLSLLFRLFVVVGLSWSYIALQDLLRAGNINTKQTWVWHIFRCLFFLQGAFISAIIITNGHTLKYLVMKYPKLKALFVWDFPQIQRRMKAILVPTTKCCCCGGFLEEIDRKESIQSNTSQRTIESIII